MLTSRSMQIIKHLSGIRGIDTIKNISKQFSITDRMVRYEVQKINEHFEKSYPEVLSLNRGEIAITIEKKEQGLLSEILDETSLLPEERELLILMDIIFNRKIKQVKLLEELDLSKTTINTHFKNIKEELKKYSLFLEIEPKKGLILVGEEEKIRQFAVKIVNIVLKSENKILEKKLKVIMGDIEAEGVNIFINYCQKKMDKIISDEAFKIIKNYLLVSICMNKKGYSILKTNNEIFLSNTEEYKVIKSGLSILEGHYELYFDKVESLKLTDYFLGSHTYNFNSSYYHNWFEIEFIVKKMIDDFNREIDVDISKDNNLMEGLVNHIKPTIYRLKNNIILENSIEEEVLETYPEYYFLASKVLKGLEDFIGIKFTKDEIAFIAIHFKAAIDRNKIIKNKSKIILVCGSGYGTSKFLEQEIKNKFDISIVKIIPKYLLLKTLESEPIDYIFTTIDLTNDKLDLDIPIIKLNTILQQEDIEKLQRLKISQNKKEIKFSEVLKVIEENTDIKNREKLIKELAVLLDNNLYKNFLSEKFTKLELLKEKNILINQEIYSWEESIRKCGNLLVEDNCINKDYIEDILKIMSESGEYMLLAPGVIFPHALPKSNVFKTGFAILTLKKPIKIRQMVVSKIVLFSSKDGKEHFDTFVKLVNIFSNESYSQELSKIKNSSSFRDFLVEKYQD